MLGGGVDAATLWPSYAPARRSPYTAGAAIPTVGQRHAVCLSVMIAVLMALASKARLGELLEVERDEGLRAAARVAVMRAVFGPRRLEPG